MVNASTGSQIVAGETSTGDGLIEITGGEINGAPGVYVGQAGPGTLTMSAGTATIGEFVVGHTAGSTGVMTLTGGTINSDPTDW